MSYRISLSFCLNNSFFVLIPVIISCFLIFKILQVDIYYSACSPWDDFCAHWLLRLILNFFRVTFCFLLYFKFNTIGYTFGAGMFEMENVKGGSPYGAGTYAGDGSRQPTELELAQAFHQGKYFAGIAKKLKGSSQ